MSRLNEITALRIFADAVAPTMTPVDVQYIFDSATDWNLPDNDTADLAYKLLDQKLPDDAYDEVVRIALERGYISEPKEG